MRLDGRANVTYLSFTGRTFATNGTGHGETTMQAITIATVETMLTQAIRNGSSPWDAFWELGLTHTVNGEEFHTLAGCVKRSIVGNATIAATAIPETVTMQPRTVEQREADDVAERAAKQEQRAATIAELGFDATVMERLQAAPKLAELETGRRDIAQVVFPRIDVAKHVNTFSCYHGEPLQIVSTYRYKQDNSPVPERAEETETAKDKKARLRAENARPFLDGNSRIKWSDDVANDIIVKRNAMTGKLVRKSNGMKPARKPMGQATCEPLFCAGERETDGFSRTMAIRYLSKRMVFSPRAVAEGKENGPEAGHVKASKGSSSQAKIAFYRASDIEDTVQEAYILWHVACEFRKGGELPTDERAAKQIQRIARMQEESKGNRLYDTCYVCREAKNNMTRARHAERKRLNVLAARMVARENAERGHANRFYDDELEQLLALARQHGTTDAKTLATLMVNRDGTQGVSLATCYNVLERVRQRCLRQEAMAERKRKERIADVFADHGV